METISVTFNTLTPIYFGDAKQEFCEIRPSAILGCMRYWLDVAFVGMGLEKSMDQLDIKNEDSNNNNGPNNEIKINDIIVEKLLKNNKNVSWDKMKLQELLNSYKIEKLSDLLFGCENFKGQIIIDKIKTIGKIETINLNHKANGIRISKEKRWYIPPKVFIGKFIVNFKVNEVVLKDYFYPLMNFINEVGYLGGKWNIGFGRVEVEKIWDNSQKKNVDFKTKTYDKFIKCIKNKYLKNNVKDCVEDHLENIKRGIHDNKGQIVKVITNEEFNNNIINRNIKKYIQFTYRDYIKNVLEKKLKYRDILRFNYNERKMEDKKSKDNNEKVKINNLRHKIFGIAGKNSQGTKILPYVGRDIDNKLKSGFLLLDGLYDLKGGENKNE